jgi:putative heme-binding domain-containing protein
LDWLGNLYFGLGENLGASYKLIGSDGSTQSGGGEGGSIYRCRPDGTKLERVATGFWNTFALAFDAFGQLFAVDNDPDSRGPCRLLHIVQGGDYGYRFRNGRKGLHPFTAWNGELPGTLPMVAGTAEAPSGILAYESIGLPSDYRGKLLVTSWGDHVIEQFTLSPRGASFSAKSSALVRGGEDFRPVAIATAPDGSIYFSDWVDKSYPVHGKGRIWRLRAKEVRKDDGLRPSKVAKMEESNLRKLLSDPRIEIRSEAALTLAIKGDKGAEILIDILKNPNTDVRTALSARNGLARSIGKGALAVPYSINHPAPEVRAKVLETYPGQETLPFERNSLHALAEKDPSSRVRVNAILQLRDPSSLKSILPMLVDNDPFLVGAALTVLGRPGNVNLLISALENAKEPKLKLGILLALRRMGDPAAQKPLGQFLKDPSPAVRRAAVQWVGEERLQQYKDAIAEAAATEPVSRDLFEALLASNELFDAKSKNPSTETSGEEYVSRIVKDAKQPAVFRTFALRMIRPEHPIFTNNLLKELLAHSEPKLRAEAVRTLALRNDPATLPLLRELAANQSAPLESRTFAVLGLAQFAPSSEESRKLLLSLLADAGLRRDALRSLRGVDLTSAEKSALLAWWDKWPIETEVSDDRREIAEQLLLILSSKPAKDDELRREQLTKLIGPAPTSPAGWDKVLAAPGDPVAGERVFFHLRGARCAVCHRLDGRGGQVGPELSAIAGSHSRSKLIESILTPSKEIAPAFTNWSITMNNGKKYSGVILSENFDSTLTLADADGKRVILKRLEIEERQASPKSIMPDDLAKLMTRREFRDLVEFLQKAKNK